ncbi:sarcospan isoform X3 [Rattus norvegicus]|uniref:sarcospan isoform X3 n=1 Tax=Rattus norvegicus TaxID=10116 RepID=UPI00191767DC|nr:sarcospan isoform X3 [Rattus norvegicus]
MGRKPGPGAQELAEEEARTCCGCRFPLLLALLQLALGIAVTVLGFLMASISPSLLVRDTPFWAGIIVCVVAYLGLFMLCVSYQVDERTCVQFSMKAGVDFKTPINSSGWQDLRPLPWIFRALRAKQRQQPIG